MTIDSAIAQIAPPMPGVGWVEGESNVNTCASLTYVTLDTEGGTVSSPYQLLLFHDGEFLGTGTSCNLSYQTVAATTDDRIDVRYRYLVGDEANADPQGEAYVSYHWNGSGVDMLGELPEAVTRGDC
ncbi:LppP/LprE family lipoprotein [Williamsia sp. 1135]|uniref:LppP/LprE family lipoprotein n=1 Tax=Williamsia sp. 1135 TaxID=1889262 RepID=UPI0014394C72|nr:LppP/LprE family lipoprotein [Williamsia sp. 1135]